MNLTQMIWRTLSVLLMLFIVVGTTWAQHKPDVVLMMADDLGFSDLGCYGGEIETPNLDALAAKGFVFRQFSNTSRCCPSRASLLTGKYSHQVGLGDMTYEGKGVAYQGQLSKQFPTVAEVLKRSGYDTAMVGKWHQTRSGTIDDGPNGSWPMQRGFDRVFGSMEGAKNYFHPKWLFDGAKEILEFDDDFYYTDAVSSRAAKWIRDQDSTKPLFLYTAFYAPHFPLQAPESEIDKYRGKYAVGWDVLRKRRLAKQKRLGVIPGETVLSDRPKDVPDWRSLSPEQRDALDRRMATYAAQVDLLDQGVGRIITALRETGRLDNTLVLFLSDNGAASSGGPFGAGPDDKVGRPDAPIKTTYGKGWATLSNTPYREHKANTHEGGVMAPLIMHWPAKLGPNQIFRDDVAHIIDIAPTLYAATNSQHDKTSVEGVDLVHERRSNTSPIFYEHEKSRAVRLSDWKLVNRGKSKMWELYNLKTDRTEQNDLSKSEPGRLSELQELWRDWAARCNVNTK